MRNTITILSLFILTGCIATSIRGANEDVQIFTNPEGAKIVALSGEHGEFGQKFCISPCVISLKRSVRSNITASKKGCRDGHAEIYNHINAGTMMTIAGVMDYTDAGGGAYDLLPNPLSLTLECGGK